MGADVQGGIDAAQRTRGKARTTQTARSQIKSTNSKGREGTPRTPAGEGALCIPRFSGHSPHPIFIPLGRTTRFPHISVCWSAVRSVWICLPESLSTPVHACLYVCLSAAHPPASMTLRLPAALARGRPRQLRCERGCDSARLG